MAAIPLFFGDKNLLIIAPTGSGKTLSYALPILTLIKVIKIKDIIYIMS